MCYTELEKVLPGGGEAIIGLPAAGAQNFNAVCAFFFSRLAPAQAHFLRQSGEL